MFSTERIKKNARLQSHRIRMFVQIINECGYTNRRLYMYMECVVHGRTSEEMKVYEIDTLRIHSGFFSNPHS